MKMKKNNIIIIAAAVLITGLIAVSLFSFVKIHKSMELRSERQSVIEKLAEDAEKYYKKNNDSFDNWQLPDDLNDSLKIINLTNKNDTLRITVKFIQNSEKEDTFKYVITVLPDTFFSRVVQ